MKIVSKMNIALWLIAMALGCDATVIEAAKTLKQTKSKKNKGSGKNRRKSKKARKAISKNKGKPQRRGSMNSAGASGGGISQAGTSGTIQQPNHSPHRETQVVSEANKDLIAKQEVDRLNAILQNFETNTIKKITDTAGIVKAREKLKVFADEIKKTNNEVLNALLSVQQGKLDKKAKSFEGTERRDPPVRRQGEQEPGKQPLTQGQPIVQNDPTKGQIQQVPKRSEGVSSVDDIVKAVIETNQTMDGSNDDAAGLESRMDQIWSDIQGLTGEERGQVKSKLSEVDQQLKNKLNELQKQQGDVTNSQNGEGKELKDLQRQIKSVEMIKTKLADKAGDSTGQDLEQKTETVENFLAETQAELSRLAEAGEDPSNQTVTTQGVEEAFNKMPEELKGQAMDGLTKLEKQVQDEFAQEQKKVNDGNEGQNTEGDVANAMERLGEQLRILKILKDNLISKMKKVKIETAQQVSPKPTPEVEQNKNEMTDENTKEEQNEEINRITSEIEKIIVNAEGRDEKGVVEEFKKQTDQLSPNLSNEVTRFIDEQSKINQENLSRSNGADGSQKDAIDQMNKRAIILKSLAAQIDLKIKQHSQVEMQAEPKVSINGGEKPNEPESSPGGGDQAGAMIQPQRTETTQGAGGETEVKVQVPSESNPDESHGSLEKQKETEKKDGAKGPAEGLDEKQQTKDSQAAGEPDGVKVEVMSPMKTEEDNRTKVEKEETVVKVGGTQPNNEIVGSDGGNVRHYKTIEVDNRSDKTLEEIIQNIQIKKDANLNNGVVSKNCTSEILKLIDSEVKERGLLTKPQWIDSTELKEINKDIKNAIAALKDTIDGSSEEPENKDKARKLLEVLRPAHDLWRGRAAIALSAQQVKSDLGNGMAEEDINLESTVPTEESLQRALIKMIKEDAESAMLEDEAREEDTMGQASIIVLKSITEANGLFAAASDEADQLKNIIIKRYNDLKSNIAKKAEEKQKVVEQFMKVAKLNREYSEEELNTWVQPRIEAYILDKFKTIVKDIKVKEVAGKKTTELTQENKKELENLRHKVYWPRNRIYKDKQKAVEFEQKLLEKCKEALNTLKEVPQGDQIKNIFSEIEGQVNQYRAAIEMEEVVKVKDKFMTEEVKKTKEEKLAKEKLTNAPERTLDPRTWFATYKDTEGLWTDQFEKKIEQEIIVDKLGEKINELVKKGQRTQADEQAAKDAQKVLKFFESALMASKISAVKKTALITTKDEIEKYIANKPKQEETAKSN